MAIGARRRIRIAPPAAFVLFSALALPARAEPPPEPDFPVLWAQQAEANPSPPATSAKSYTAPLYGIIGFNILLNLFDRAFVGDDFETNLSTIHRNLHRGPEEDNSKFGVNQLGHPYQGSMYHGFARSAGLSYWESLPYVLGGSAMWEVAGETGTPSRNDLITTTVAGSFLGEALFRMANLVLEDGGGLPRPWREVGAAILSPAMGFNRYFFDKRFPIFPSNSPAYYGQVQIGGGVMKQSDPSGAAEREKGAALADFSLDYGLPGKDGYRYRRPFDYFTFRLTGTSDDAVESLATRGLLLGTDYSAGRDVRGIWGLYGSYDYLAPQFFRVSSAALSLGTTGQARLGAATVLQGSALAGTGYTAVGGAGARDERDNEYGLAPQAHLALKLIFAERAAAEFAATKYFASAVGAAADGGHDHITRADAAFTWRVHRRHAVSLRYIWTHRDAALPGLVSATQIRRMAGIYYTYLGHQKMGAVAWR
jgi:hypothetical protein